MKGKRKIRFAAFVLALILSMESGQVLAAVDMQDGMESTQDSEGTKPSDDMLLDENQIEDEEQNENDTSDFEENIEDDDLTEDGTTEVIPDGEQEEQGETQSDNLEEPMHERQLRLTYRAHVQNIGWQDPVEAGQMAGTSGKFYRMEAVEFFLEDASTGENLNHQIEYRAHVQDIGWQNWVSGGEIAGTTGKRKRVEAIQIRFKGDLEETYDIYYCTHISNIGNLAWTSNGAESGSEGLAEHIEAITVQVFKKGDTDVPSKNGAHFVKDYNRSDLQYSGHVQNVVDTKPIIEGETLGTIGKNLRIEGLNISLNTESENALKGGIAYRLHVQDIGWQDWKYDGEYAGTKGKRLKVEAIQIKLTGDVAKYYNVYYRAHVQNFGWLGWTLNGNPAGSQNLSYRMEALQIQLVPKRRAQISTSKAFWDTYVYQNPSQYLQIKHVQKTLSGGGYNLSSGYMGVKVKYVQKKLGLGSRRAIMDATTMLSVRKFQKAKGLPVTGVVNLATWKALGYTENQWYTLGTYVAPLKTSAVSSRKDCIEAMISTAYKYLGTEYVIGAAGAPGTGADCSGLVMQALYSAGIDPAPVSPIRHSRPGYEYESRNLWNLPMKKVPYSQRQRGDLIFYQSSNGVIIHVAIYLGNDKVIEEWPTKAVVWPIKNSHRSNIKGVMRPFV